jgi:hypothetical protein
MIQSKVLVAGAASELRPLPAIAQRKLTWRINRWAHKNKLNVVRVGYGPAGCSKGALAVCTATAKVLSLRSYRRFRKGGDAMVTYS